MLQLNSNNSRLCEDSLEIPFCFLPYIYTAIAGRYLSHTALETKILHGNAKRNSEVGQHFLAEYVQ